MKKEMRSPTQTGTTRKTAKLTRRESFPKSFGLCLITVVRNFDAVVDRDDVVVDGDGDTEDFVDWEGSDVVVVVIIVSVSNVDGCISGADVKVVVLLALLSTVETSLLGSVDRYSPDGLKSLGGANSSPDSLLLNGGHVASNIGGELTWGSTSSRDLGTESVMLSLLAARVRLSTAQTVSNDARRNPAIAPVFHPWHPIIN